MARNIGAKTYMNYHSYFISFPICLTTGGAYVEFKSLGSPFEDNRVVVNTCGL